MKKQEAYVMLRAAPEDEKWDEADTRDVFHAIFGHLPTDDDGDDILSNCYAALPVKGGKR